MRLLRDWKQGGAPEPVIVSCWSSIAGVGVDFCIFGNSGLISAASGQRCEAPKRAADRGSVKFR
jgi:hypothetical protein